MDDPSLPRLRSFHEVGDWCQEYLELQHSRELGQTFGRIVRVLGAIASLPHDGVDRFEWLKERESEVLQLLVALSEYALPPLVPGDHVGPARGADGAGEQSKHGLLFVYGTLKRGQSRASAMDGQKFLGEAVTRPRYRLYDCGGYPGLVEVDRGVPIRGEVWEVTPACLARLDDIEGVSYRLYARRPILLEPPFEDRPVESYYYLRRTAGLADCGTSWVPASPGRSGSSAR